tara:strand:+ start:368 stop:559 length:192 start_codon:yes stop_codon:yes gene_type:complete
MLSIFFFVKIKTMTFIDLILFLLTYFEFDEQTVVPYVPSHTGTPIIEDKFDSGWGQFVDIEEN